MATQGVKSLIFNRLLLAGDGGLREHSSTWWRFISQICRGTAKCDFSCRKVPHPMPRCLYLLTARNLLLLTSLLAVTFANRLLAQDLAEKADVANQLGSEVASETTDAAKLAGDDEGSADGSTRDDIAAGHSFHGEAFNEGPRQAAYLMPGLGRVDFPVSTTNELMRMPLSAVEG